MEQERFLEACRWAASRENTRQGIGTLGEKTLHSAVKYYFQPDPETREVPVGPFVADALVDGGVVEVQSRPLYRLRPKLEYFLARGKATVVYPVPAKKTVVWISPEGDMTPPRKSPLKPTAGAGAAGAVRFAGVPGPPRVLPVRPAVGSGRLPPSKRLGPGQEAGIHPLRADAGFPAARGVGALPRGVWEIDPRKPAAPVYQPRVGTRGGGALQKGQLGCQCPAKGGGHPAGGKAGQRLSVYPGGNAL